MLSMLKKFRIYIILLVIVLAGVWFFLLDRDNDVKMETETLVKRDIVEVVTETGEVRAKSTVRVAFEIPGRISGVSVKVGDKVEKDQVLVKLDDSIQRSELRSAEARLKEMLAGADESSIKTIQASLDTAENFLQNVRSARNDIEDEYDMMVQNAKRVLFSSDLQARLTGGSSEDSLYSYTPPTVIGAYTGEIGGDYRLNLFPSGRDSGYSYRFFGIEEGIGGVSTTEFQSLGTRGLFIRFPDNFARDSLVEWTISIPNKNSASYIGSLNAYESALESRGITLSRADRAISEAEKIYEETLVRYEQAKRPAREEQIEAQEALMEMVKTTLSKTEIRAPFDGVVTHVDVEVGDYVSVGMPVVDFMSDGDLEIKVYVPESNSTLLDVGDKANVRLDAYRGEVFEAEVISVSPRARRFDGISSFETVLAFANEDPRVRAGMTGDVDIFVAVSEDVFSIPARAVVVQDGLSGVRVLNPDGTVRFVEVKTGLRGVDGRIEIIGDLSKGKKVIVYMEE